MRRYVKRAKLCWRILRGKPTYVIPPGVHEVRYLNSSGDLQAGPGLTPGQRIVLSGPITLGAAIWGQP